jgi:hypothetical protein
MRGRVPSADLVIRALKGRPIGRVLLKMGRVTPDQVTEALQSQKCEVGIMLGRVLIDLGYVRESDVKIALAAQRGCSSAAISKLFGEPLAGDTLQCLRNLEAARPRFHAAGGTCEN